MHGNLYFGKKATTFFGCPEGQIKALVSKNWNLICNHLIGAGFIGLAITIV